jgi:CDP-glycerol glycerophosphotransferase (TagB/SpsB family)
MAYSSVISHGEPLLRSLLESGDFRVVYRPHPRTGANRADFAAADHRLRALVRAPQDDAAGPHHVDLTPTWDTRSALADLLIGDISAVATDWMTTGKPIIVTVPASHEAYLDVDTVLGAVPGIDAADVGRAAELVRVEPGGGHAARRQAWVAWTMGDTTPGASLRRFLLVCDDLVEQRGRELSARAARLSRHSA